MVLFRIRRGGTLDEIARDIGEIPISCRSPVDTVSHRGDLCNSYAEGTGEAPIRNLFSAKVPNNSQGGKLSKIEFAHVKRVGGGWNSSAE